MISIVVPAYNEGAVIARTLSALTDGAAPGELEIVVVCNGCTDDTAEAARRFGPPVRVIETAVASKTHALNLGDAAAGGFPRIYLDADVVLTIDAVRALARRLDRGDLLAAAPLPRIDTTGCSALVRAYFGIRSLLPSSREGIGGSGVYALSAAGRRRFGEFPDVTADDAFVRFQFAARERETTPLIASTVFAPRTLRQLVAVRSRVYYGMFELARRFPQLKPQGGASNRRALAGLLGKPGSWVGLAVYGYVCVVARLRAARRMRAGSYSWQRDGTSRAATLRSSKSACR